MRLRSILSTLMISVTISTASVFGAKSLPVTNNVTDIPKLQQTFRTKAKIAMSRVGTGSLELERQFSNTKRTFRLDGDVNIAELNTQLAAGTISLYATPKTVAPMFSRPDISHIFGGGTATGGLEMDMDDLQIYDLEFMARHGSVLSVEALVTDGNHYVARVTTPDYQYAPEEGHAYYIDARMLRLYWAPYGKLDSQHASEKALVPFPTANTILSRMESLSGSIYVWGGNVPGGIPSLETLYPPKTPLDPDFRKKWTLDGVDCTGLLYFATDGKTPRNTSSLVTYGTGLDIAGKDADAIAAQLKPLDLITWRGHLIIVLDDHRVIESAFSLGGVRISETKTRLSELLATKAPLNAITDPIPEGKAKGFVIRRWHTGE